MKPILTAALAAVSGLALMAGSAPRGAHADAPAAQLPQHVDDFQLTDATLMAERLYYYNYAPAIVLMSESNSGTESPAAAQALQKLADAYKDKGVVTFMLNSNLADSRDATAAWGKAQHVTVPILMDEQQLVGEGLGVQREGEVFVIDPKTWTIAYHGPVSDAQAALDAVLVGKPAPEPRVAVTTGSAIAFPARAQAAEFAKISYSKDVAPILQAKCAGCHIKGGIGPFAMTSYDVVKGFAPMIRETIRTRRMPPYYADPHIGAFKNDQGLTADQTKTLVHWIEAGAPRGEGPDPLLANAGKVAPEWPKGLGQPDVIVKLPAFHVAATGLIDYQEIYVDNPMKKDAWLRAVAIRPGDRRVLHHVVSNTVPDPNNPPDIPGGSVGSYTPGARPQIMADGSGAPVPGGGKLHFQMHYTTIGKPTTDETEVGFYLLKAPPKYIKRSVVIGNFNMTIPAGDPRHVETAYMTWPADAYVYTLYPHAHYRGMHVELRERTPDGKEKLLLVLPKYDFNWQRDYDPVQPLFIKAGTKLIATWVYDNSAHNLANPDPKRTVTWGEQTKDEMMYFRVNYRWADETTSHIRNDLQQKLQQSGFIGALDTNVDGVVEKSELRGRMGAMLAPRFDQLDKDHDGTLDASELAAAMPQRGHRQQAQKQQDNPDL